MPLELASLSSLSSFEQILSTQGVEALLAALDEALARLPAEARTQLEDGPTVGPRTLRLLGKALALDAPFLRAHPEALFQCLYNRLRWFDAPDVAPHFMGEGVGPWAHPEAHLSRLAEHWRRQRDVAGGAPWLESLLPLPGELESQDVVLPHGAHVLCAAFDVSGKRLATGSWSDGRNVHVWDVASGKCLQVMAGHECEVLGVAWSPDGTRLASGSRDHDVRLWDVETGELLHAMTGQEGRVSAVAFSPEGRVLAAANLGWKVRLFDTASGAEVRTLEGHEQSVLCVAFHPSGRWLASGASDETVILWDMETGAQAARIEADAVVQSVAFSPDGEWLAITAEEGVALVETRGWTRVRTAGGSDRYAHVAWLGTGMLGVLTYDRVEVLDARDGKVVRTRPYKSDGNERSVAFHPDGRRFALTAADGKVRVSDMEAKPAPSLLDLGPVQELWATPEGRVGAVRRQESTSIVDSRGRIRSIGADFAEAYGRSWEANAQGTLFAYPVIISNEEVPRAGVRLLDVETLTPVRTLSVRRVGGAEDAELFLGEQPIAFSPDGTLLAAVIEEGAVRVWRVSDGQLLHTLRGHEGAVLLVEFTPDGTCVVSGSSLDSRLLVHEVKGGTRVLETEARLDPVPSYDVATRAPCFAVGRFLGEIEIFELPGVSRLRIQGEESPKVSVGLSEDGSLVGACCEDNVVRVFDARTGALRCEVPHPSRPYQVALGGDMLVTRTDHPPLRFFDLATGAPRGELPAHAAARDVAHLKFWEALGEEFLELHRQLDPSPLVHFHDSMENSVMLRDGLLLGRGRLEKDALYVLKLHAPGLEP